MFKLVSLLAVVAYASAGILPEFIRFPRLDGRIVGGSPTTIQQHPYQISLQYYGSHMCGGSLISENQIVTAAHCLEGMTARSLQVRAGSTSRSSGGVLLDVAEIKMNPSYDPYEMSNDIGIVTLATPVQFSDSIQPIPLARENPAPNTQAVASGWGALNEGSYGLPTVLQEVTVDIVSHEQCQKSYGRNYDITESMLCAAAENKDACQGDSGGPLVANNQLVGVVSWGIGCARAQYPGVYSSVANLRDWVIENSDL